MNVWASPLVSWLLGKLGRLVRKRKQGLGPRCGGCSETKQFVSPEGSLLAESLFPKSEKGHRMKDVCVHLIESFRGGGKEGKWHL